MRISRDDDILSARRNSVSSSKVVGNTLNSTGRPMYMATNSTMTESVMLALISRSSRKLGMGRIIAMMIPITARGTPISEMLPNRDVNPGATPPPAIFAPERALAAVPRGFLSPLGDTAGGAGTGFSCGAAAMYGGYGAIQPPYRA